MPRAPNISGLLRLSLSRVGLRGTSKIERFIDIVKSFTLYP